MPWCEPMISGSQCPWSNELFIIGSVYEANVTVIKLQKLGQVGQNDLI